MDETYRMLGRERALDFEREARRRGLAALAREKRPTRPRAAAKPLRESWFALTRSKIAALLG